MRRRRNLASLITFLASSGIVVVVHGAATLNFSRIDDPYHNGSLISSFPSHSSSLSTNNPSTCSKIRTNCSTNDGLIIPLWRPQEGISLGDRISRALVYLLALVYMFIGVAIISDRFMAAIEVITSQKREIRKKNPDGTISITTVSIWNETVSNLTLMALGSSAPEILLSIIEVVGKNFKSGK